MPAGILFVFSDPGPAVSEAEYHDWYDNEHVPLRLPIPSFNSWSRWAAIDNARPAYLALYDLDSASAVDEPAYASLAQTRSARETDIIARLAVLDRRTYDALEVRTPPRDPQYDVRRPGPYVSAVMMDVPAEHEEDFNRWYDEEHIELLSKAPQWVRSTRWVLRDGGATGTDESLKPKGGRAPKYLALHEWTDPGVVQTEELKQALSTPWTARVTEYAEVFDRRMFKLMRSWEP